MVATAETVDWVTVRNETEADHPDLGLEHDAM